jgi:putative hydroxymethylpyrimidine transporter CytX
MKTEILSSPVLGALWFGAAVSTAEILTGGLIAPLGWGWGLAVILFGHLVGGLVFFGAGWMSSKTGLNAIGVSAPSFGPWGPRLFGLINVLQLVGWTAVMVILGSQSLDALSGALWGFHLPWLWKLVLGALLLLWAASGLEGIRRLNTAAVILLFALTLVMGWVVFHADAHPAPATPLSLSDALELVVVMPLSWLPLVGDYTRRAGSPLRGNLIAVIGYVVGSVWMYSIGLASALALGTADPTQQMLRAGLGLAGLAIIAVSTATSGFLDVVSAGLSFNNIVSKAGAKISALVLGGVGIALALVFPMDQYQNFLYILGALFGPLYAVLLSDYLFLKRRLRPTRFAVISFAAWTFGACLYFLLIYGFPAINTLLGVTVPTMLATAVLNLVLKTLFVPKEIAHEV